MKTCDGFHSEVLVRASAPPEAHHEFVRSHTRDMAVFAPLRSLRNRTFARLYIAHTASLLGDAFTWVGLALLAFQLRGKDSAGVLAFALTLRVTAYIVLSPVAGVLADRLNRKTILVTCDVARFLVIGLMPFASEEWHVYALMFLVNAFTAFFTPTFQATIPAVTKGEDYAKAISLSGATTELLGVLGPGIAGAAAAFMGAREIFFVDAASFLISGAVIVTLRASLGGRTEVTTEGAAGVRDVAAGTRLLWKNGNMRFALLLELVASISGALVLVNTVGLVRGTLGLGESSYGLVMMAFGVGATAAALLFGVAEKRVSRRWFLIAGATVTSLAVMPANQAALAWLLPLWLLAGAGQNWVNLAAQTVIADETQEGYQGRVYGAHFAWSHFWWAFAYPIAGFLGEWCRSRSFLYGGLVALAVLAIVAMIGFATRRPTA
jgi:MFS transporter, NRE family, putaive nickel resistance protein